MRLLNRYAVLLEISETSIVVALTVEKVGNTCLLLVVLIVVPKLKKVHVSATFARCLSAFLL